MQSPLRGAEVCAPRSGLGGRAARRALGPMPLPPLPAGPWGRTSPSLPSPTWPRPPFRPVWRPLHAAPLGPPHDAAISIFPLLPCSRAYAPKPHKWLIGDMWLLTALDRFLTGPSPDGPGESLGPPVLGSTLAPLDTAPGGSSGGPAAPPHPGASREDSVDNPFQVSPTAGGERTPPYPQSQAPGGGVSR